MVFLKLLTIYWAQDPAHKFRTMVPPLAKNLFLTFEDSLVNREHMTSTVQDYAVLQVRTCRYPYRHPEYGRMRSPKTRIKAHFTVQSWTPVPNFWKVSKFRERIHKGIREWHLQKSTMKVNKSSFLRRWTLSMLYTWLFQARQEAWSICCGSRYFCRGNSNATIAAKCIAEWYCRRKLCMSPVVTLSSSANLNAVQLYGQYLLQVARVTTYAPSNDQPASLQWQHQRWGHPVVISVSWALKKVGAPDATPLTYGKRPKRCCSSWYWHLAQIGSGWIESSTTPATGQPLNKQWESSWMPKCSTACGKE